MEALPESSQSSARGARPLDLRFGDALVGVPLLALFIPLRSATPLMAFVGPRSRRSSSSASGAMLRVQSALTLTCHPGRDPLRPVRPQTLRRTVREARSSPPSSSSSPSTISRPVSPTFTRSAPPRPWASPESSTAYNAAPRSSSSTYSGDDELQPSRDVSPLRDRRCSRPGIADLERASCEGCPLALIILAVLAAPPWRN